VAHNALTNHAVQEDFRRWTAEQYPTQWAEVEKYKKYLTEMGMRKYKVLRTFKIWREFKMFSV
jgi:uncharacterized membrane protein